MLKNRKVWIDGKFTPFDKAQVHIMSHAFCRGSAIFEVMSCHPTEKGPAIFRLKEHVDRIFNSAKLLDMKLPLSKKALREAVVATVAKNKVKTAIIKLMCFYPGIEFEVIPNDRTLRLVVVVVDPHEDLSERYREIRNVTVTISRWRKLDPQSVPVDCKAAANYLNPMVAKIDARKRGFGAPVLLDNKGFIAEGATESIFLVKNGRIKTPALGNILPGITRASTIELARDLNFKVIEKRIRPKELMEADEAFFTTTPLKIWPIEKVDNQQLEAPGMVSDILGQSLVKICQGNIKRYNKWLTPVKP